ncbi:MAG TPA: proteasome-activating nucleotidase [archaeon]|nr:proteasome-activating nucleotidase [archaeon]
MAETGDAIKKTNYDVYDYVFSLEEQLKTLQTERQMNSARITQMQIDLQRAQKELAETKIPPLVVGTIGEVLDEKTAIVKNSNGMEFLVKAITNLNEKLDVGKRVAMNQRSLIITQIFPENKDWRVTAMEVIEKPTATFEEIGGLKNEIQELEEAVILPLINPEGFERLGIDPPNGVLLHGPPGTGKTLLAKAVANKTHATFISLSGSDLVRKYIGEGSKLVRDVFRLAKEKKPSIIFIDEIDAVGSQRFATANGDREVQRTLMQLLSEMDGFHEIKGVKIIGATNRVDMLDQALLRPGRFDRLIEIPLPDEESRKKIFEIHTQKMKLDSKIVLDDLAGLTDGFTGAEIKSACTEAGMFALRKKKNKISLTEFNEAVQKISKKSSDEAGRPNEKMFA